MMGWTMRKLILVKNFTAVKPVLEAYANDGWRVSQTASRATCGENVVWVMSANDPYIERKLAGLNFTHIDIREDAGKVLPKDTFEILRTKLRSPLND